VSWSASRDGLAIYRGGELVALVPFSAFGRLIYDLAKVLR
jgi:hypothetical protein